MKAIRYFQTLGSFRNYYRSINEILFTAFGKQHMLHYPYYMRENETLEERQNNLIDHCLSYIGDLEGKELLEVGCGNGMNCNYIDHRYQLKNITGIDLNTDNLSIARGRNMSKKVKFIHDDAQELKNIPDNSIDVVICIESAFHYPDKNAFFRQIKRILRPEGEFIIVDIVRSPGYKDRSSKRWDRKKLFFHADEKEYRQFLNGNNLVFQTIENITDRIIQGYQGHRGWITRQNMNIADYLLMRLFSRLQVRVNVAELKSSKQYMLLYGRHQDPMPL